MEITLATPIEQTGTLGRKWAPALRALGVFNVGQLIAHLPMRHEFQEAETTIDQLEAGSVITARGDVTATRVVARGKRPRFEVVLMDHTGRLDLVWFNQLYMRQKIHPGMRLRVTGQSKRFGPGIQLANPRIEILDGADGEPEAKGERLRPVYPASEEINSRQIEEVVRSVLEPALGLIEDHLPEAFRRERSMPALAESHRMMHAPVSEEEIAAARRRLAYDELLLLQLGVQMKRAHLRETLKSPALRWSEAIDRHIRERFPFTLTRAQEGVVREIIGDLTRAVPTNRLIQGDVGSGKTIVALYAMLMAVASGEGGQQAALMAPTELLAEQHFSSISRILEGSRVRVELLTGTVSGSERESILSRIESGDVDLVIGTHALLTESVRFHSLAVAIIDEQHRFGVHQRATMRTKGSAMGGAGVPPARAQAGASPAPGGDIQDDPKRTIGRDLVVYKRRLPHWQRGGSTYFITFRTAKGELSEAERQVALDACVHWHGERMRVHLVSVMPDHVHMLIRPLNRDQGDWHSLGELIHSIKGFSAHKIGALRGIPGSIWQEEHYDRIIRSEDDFYEKWKYIWMNPVNAGLVERPEDYRFTLWPERLPDDEDGEAESGEAPDLDPGGRDARPTQPPAPSVEMTPHVLVMTATPIPRTLALTLFGDLDVSTIGELPPGRTPIATRVVPPQRAAEVYAWVRTRLDAGEQAYIVVPAIDTGDDNAAAVGAEGAAGAGLKDLRSLQKRLEEHEFAGKRIAAVHGRLKRETREHVMGRFRAGLIDALIATTVIEVGVDVPNATIMVVEHADRFGLAQLHQLRGRVGRGTRRSACILIGQPLTVDAESRLKTMAETTDGFALAERDMEIRGFGEVFGIRQAGAPPFKVADLTRDLDLLALARRDASAWIAGSPALSHEAEALLRRRLFKAHGKWLGLGDVG